MASGGRSGRSGNSPGCYGSARGGRNQRRRRRGARRDGELRRAELARRDAGAIRRDYGVVTALVSTRVKSRARAPPPRSAWRLAKRIGGVAWRWVNLAEARRA